MKAKLISLLFAGTSILCSISQAAVIGPDNNFDKNIIWSHPNINVTDANGLATRGALFLDMTNDVGAVDRFSEALKSYGENMRFSSSEISELFRTLTTSKVLSSYPNAIQIVSDWLEENPSSAHRTDMKLLLADLTLETGDYVEAAKIFNDIEIDALTPNLKDDFLYHSAYTYLKLADYEKALLLFNNPELLQSVAYGNGARFYLGYISYIKKDYREALEIWENVNQSSLPSNLVGFYKAQIAYYNGNYDDALRIIRPLVSAKGTSKAFEAEANRIIGESLYQKGEFSSAIPYLKQYISEVETPENSVLYILGLAYYEQGEYKSAITSLTPVTEGQTAMAQSAYLYIGQALLKLGDDNGAIMAFNRAIELDIDHDVTETAYYNYAVARSRGGGVPFSSSVVVFEEFITRFPKSRFADDVAQYIVTGYLTEGDYQAALNSINKIRQPSTNILSVKQKVLYQLGAQQIASGNYAEAVRTLQQASQLSQYNPEIATEIKLLLGEALYRTGNFEESSNLLLEFLDEAPSDSPNRPIALYDLGYTRMAQKEWNKAQLNFERLLSSSNSFSDKTLADVQARLGDAYYYQRNWKKAADSYDNAYNLDSQYGDYPLFQKAVMQGYSRNYAGKLSSLELFKSSFPYSALMPDVLIEEAEAYTQLKQRGNARQVYENLIQEYGQTSQGRQAYLYLASDLAGEGNIEEAIKTYQSLIASSSSSEEARLAIEAVKRLHAEQGTLNKYADFVANIEGAPVLDPAEAETLSWNAAEHAYLRDKDTSLLKNFIAQYPAGPYSARALNYLLDESEEKGNDADSYNYASILIENFPDNSATEQALIIKADIDYEAGCGIDALRSWEMLEQKSSTPDNKNIALLGIMRVARDTDNALSMQRTSEKLLSSSIITPDERIEAQFSKALALKLEGNTTEALKIWKELSLESDKEFGAMSAVYAAETLNDSSNFEQSAKILESFVNSGTTQTYWLARGFIALSDSYAGQGRDFEAREYLRALKENYPGDENDIFKMIEQRLK